MAIMEAPVPAAATTGGQYRRPIIVAAIGMTAREGWSAVTMARLAESVGISRQTVYNEVGSKSALAELMVTHERDRFLTLVDSAFDRNPENLPEAVYDAVRSVLDHAGDNVLLHAVASATHGADTELLPLLTTRAGSLINEVSALLVTRIAEYRTGLADDRVAVLVDMLVRAVLSHVMQPSDTPPRTADGLAWVAARVVGQAGDTPLRHSAH